MKTKQLQTTRPPAMTVAIITQYNNIKTRYKREKEKIKHFS